MKKILTIIFPAIFIGLAGCQSAPQAETPDVTVDLLGQPWNLTMLAGKKVALGENQKAIFIQFSQDPQNFTGFAGCNNYSGRFEMTETTLELGPAMATRKMCQAGMQQEQGLFKAFSETDLYQIDANTLTLMDDANQPLATFIAVTKKSSKK
ncbi:META domain-containing protein [Thalassotalea sp. Y01]|uniref:META domain-containing protein n=1 Tax=Thalassotalea sp. Y01 TaxID=2729613 RepID=UPI00145C61D9|nr:META domain-containing protein [Thalassotalea sp. Y01]NMP16000.1 META domain-containing protein [Thalassotalea sp. Y01]